MADSPDVLSAGNSIETVKVGTLDLAPYKSVGAAFEGYKWFEETHWHKETAAHGEMVVFTGIIPDEAATKNFYERKKYAFRTGFKAMQLEPNYGLTEDKLKLSFLVRFAVAADGGFKVQSGSLGILSKAGEWRRQTLSDKALVEVLRGIYINRNPYDSLIEGLPFQ